MRVRCDHGAPADSVTLEILAIYIMYFIVPGTYYNQICCCIFEDLRVLPSICICRPAITGYLQAVRSGGEHTCHMRDTKSSTSFGTLRFGSLGHKNLCISTSPCVTSRSIRLASLPLHLETHTYATYTRQTLSIARWTIYQTIVSEPRACIF